MSSRVQTVIYNGKPCLDPRSLYREMIDRNLPVDSWFGKANSFVCPLGETPGTGTILLTEKQVTDLSAVTTDADLEFIDDGTPVTLKKIVFIGSECVTPADAGNPETVHVCRLADRRHHVAKIPVNKAYNLRTDDGTDYHSGTKNAGTAWTWARMLGNLWAMMTDLGSYPGLGFTPHGTPENFDYYGSTAWHALCDVLTRLACAVKYDPLLDTFAIVRLGDAYATANTAIAALEVVTGRPVWDEYPVAAVRAGRPEKVRVLFGILPAPTDGTTPYSAEDVTLAAGTGVVTGSYVTLYDDLSSLTGNAATRTARASERATDWLRKYEHYDLPFVRVYDGFHGTKAVACLGTTIGSLAWSDRGGGGRTELVARPDGGLEGWRLAVARVGPGGGPTEVVTGISCTSGTITVTTVNIAAAVIT